MKNVWRDYWRTTDDLPSEKMNCLVVTSTGAYRKAKYEKDDNKFVIVKKQKGEVSVKEVTDVTHWIPYPFSEIKVDNPDVPVECVYRHLFEEWLNTCDAVRVLKAHIRTLYKFIDKGEINEEAMNEIHKGLAHRITGEIMSNVEKEIQKQL